MSASATRAKILEIIATDRTFERVVYKDREAWLGKCLHCNAHLYVALDGEPISEATIEHIVPKTAGGSEELTNLALACARCNHEKGIRHDPKRRATERSFDLQQKLLAKRMKRWRDPAERGA